MVKPLEFTPRKQVIGMIAHARSVEFQPSETAMSTALLRALAAHDEREEIRGSDYLAHLFLTEDRQSLLKDSATRRWVIQNKIKPGMYEFMIARTAFFDGAVEQGLQQNIPQIVFLGAGYDSRPYRFQDRVRDPRLFELDALPTQTRKKEILERAHLLAPGQVTFVPINFNTDKLADILLAAGLRTDQRTLFIWEGVTYYLFAQSVDDTLSSIKAIAPAGSSVCFDYASLSPQALADDGVRQVREKLISDHPGEPTRFGIPAGTIGAFLAARGYAIEEHLAPDEMERRYLSLHDGSIAGKLPELLCLVRARISV